MSNSNTPNTQSTAGATAAPTAVATSACILGVVSLLLTWALGVGGIILGLAAIVISVVALVRIQRRIAGGRTRAIVGLVAGICGILLLGVGIILFSP